MQLLCEEAMKIINITSDSIPWLSDDIKKSINSGDWILFTSRDSDTSNYFLDIGDRILKINGFGILENLDKSYFSPEIDQIIYFSDIKKPSSLSNTNIFSH